MRSSHGWRSEMIGGATMLAGVVLLGSCSPMNTTESQLSNASSRTGPVSAKWTSQTVSATVGQEIDVTLGTVGPGNYDTPPVLSSANVSFVTVSYIGPYLPSGPTQLFQFTATSPGRTIVSFRQVGRGGDEPVGMVQDTIIVQ